MVITKYQLLFDVIAFSDFGNLLYMLYRQAIDSTSIMYGPQVKKRYL